MWTTKLYKVTLRKEQAYVVVANDHDEAIDKAIDRDLQEERRWIEDPYTEMESEEVL